MPSDSTTLYAFLKQNRLPLLILTAFFYCWIGFQFGHGNNVEEVPVIYSKAVDGLYPADPFISASSQQFNANSIYTSFFAQLAKLFGYQHLKSIFFVFHFIYVLGLFAALVALIRLTSRTAVSPYYSMIAIVLLMFGEKILHWMPNQRALFISFVDPMGLVAPFIFGAIYFFVRNRHAPAALLLLTGSLIHPLYTLPVAGIFIGITLLTSLRTRLWRGIFTSSMLYFLSVIPYTLILWYLSRQGTISEHNPTLIHEIIRAPHHLVIPSLQSSDRLSYIRFFELSFLFSALAIVLLHYKRVWSPFGKVKTRNEFVDKKTSIQRLILVLAGLLIYLLGASLAASFVRLDLLVSLTPYRMGAYALILAFVLLTAAASYVIKDFKVNPKIALGLLVVLLGLNLKTLLHQPTPTPRSDAINWINENTDRKSLWLNYSDLDIRTHCLRSDYFQFKTIPVTADGQLDWYGRLCQYYSIPEGLEKNYVAVRDYIKSDGFTINLSSVLDRVEEAPLNYLLIDKMHKKHFQSIPGQPLFKNKKYEVYELRK